MTRMREIQNKIENADAILIAASNGLSISEGYHLFVNYSLIFVQSTEFGVSFRE